MTEMIRGLANWQTLFVLLAVSALYGIAPGAMLRLTVRMYRADHPRRRELIAELYAMPRRHRPIWVLEQLETAVAEGLAPRVGAVWRQPFRRLAVLLTTVVASVILVAALVTLGAPTPLRDAVTLAGTCLTIGTAVWAHWMILNRRKAMLRTVILGGALGGAVVTAATVRIDPLSAVGWIALWLVTATLALAYVRLARVSWKNADRLERGRVRRRRAQHRERVRQRRDRITRSAVASASTQV